MREGENMVVSKYQKKSCSAVQGDRSMDSINSPSLALAHSVILARAPRQFNHRSRVLFLNQCSLLEEGGCFLAWTKMRRGELGA